MRTDIPESQDESLIQAIAEFTGNADDLLSDGKAGCMPLLITRNLVAFPGVLATITIARKSTKRLTKYLQKHADRPFAIFCQKDPTVDEPTTGDVCDYGVIAQVLKVFDFPKPDGGQVTALLAQATTRCHITHVVDDTPHYTVAVDINPETERDDDEFRATAKQIREQIHEYGTKDPAVPYNLLTSLDTIDDPRLFINSVAYNLPLDIDDKTTLLEDSDYKLRALRLCNILDRELKYADMRISLQQRTQNELDDEQRKYFLRHQLKSINRELGDDNATPELHDLMEKAAKKHWSQTTQEAFDKEVARLKQMHQQSPDYNTQLTYLQQVVELPWEEYTDDDLDLKRAERMLNHDHYGMEKVKERILEYIAVLSLRGDLKSPILCLYGPPGVGKTSLGKSIAKALRRKYVRMSLGGLHDEAEIRGHRRTYVGAMPGRIIKNIEKAGTSNPVFILDEIDKVTRDTTHGDPSSALLEVLDPEQNGAFHDNFLELDYDLSKVLFIATANDISTIPAPLRDRMEMIEVSGYTTEEKIEIARRHLVPREMEKTGLTRDVCPTFRKAALELIIERYTRESGVRGLEKQINKCLRRTAFMYKRDGAMPNDKITPDVVETLLGKPPYYRDIYQGNAYAGVVTGLAWTSVGGEILFIETSLSKGKDCKLTLTGNLGDVMKESAVIALEYVKAHADTLDIDPEVFTKWNIHIHVPEGATPKDGPSAGITIATSIASALTQRKVRRNVAMTGEITLRGKVLPVGGIKEKILAAKRAGITDIMLCEANKKDIEEIPAAYLKGVSFHYVESVADVWQYALTNEHVSNPIQLTAGN